MIFDLNTLHVLTTDIKDTVNIRLEEGCRIIVSNSFNLTHIKLKVQKTERLIGLIIMAIRLRLWQTTAML